ncbi:MAG: class II histone deacetylase, partial [Thermoleophilia bacterium]|nr:class II histone deacetylase [Thermoleophilia bacterium]
MTRTGFVWDEKYVWFDSRGYADWLPQEALFQPMPSPETPEGKRRFKNLLDAAGITPQLVDVPSRLATVDEIARLHDRDYIARIKELSDTTGGDAGEETPFGRGGYEIALLAAGGAMNAVAAVLEGTVDNAYALVRPPGHHAEYDLGRGYCIFANTALAARHAQLDHGLKRVAIVDWDVHHGNGTEHAFYNDPSVLAISLHQDNNYPIGSGLVGDIGDGHGIGATLNIPLPAGGGRQPYELAFIDVVIPALERFQPELLLIASGLDANRYDINARMDLTAEDYRVFTQLLMDAADRLCGGRLVIIHE